VAFIYAFRWVGCHCNNWPSWLRLSLYILFAVLAWYAMLLSGIHATIAGVALGLVLREREGHKAAHALQPLTNAVILPLFAFASALVVIPQVSPADLSPAFWAITIALPAGKLVGIVIAGSAVAWVVSRRSKRDSREARQTLVTGWDLVAVAGVSGIGFTVSLLMTELAFAGDATLRDQGVLAVLCGSAIAIVVGGSLISIRARAHRQRNHLS
jgi:NhaA family Na+:H+ antiporter